MTTQPDIQADADRDGQPATQSGDAGAIAASATEAALLDAQDPLAPFRERFVMPRDDAGEPLTYLCGHSLGLQPVAARDYLQQELDIWARRGVYGHFEGERPWYSYHETLQRPMAEIVGALPEEVVMMNSLTVNLHLLMVSFYRPTVDRFKILIEEDAFPSDRFAVESQIRFHGYDPQRGLVALRPREGEDTLRTQDVVDLLGREGRRIALVLLSGVNYVTGQALDIEAIARAARQAGCVVGFDLAHAAGNIPLKLHDWNVDFAVWCSYKYLNSGPGSVGGAFVHQRHSRRADLPRFAGWWGHDPATRFALRPAFSPMPGAAGWQLSNAPVLSMAACRASLDLFQEAGMPALRAKSEKLTARLLEWLQAAVPAGAIQVITPADPASRGAQVSLRVTSGDAKALHAALEADGIVCDYREPGIIRVAPVPLYNTFQDVRRFADSVGRHFAPRP